MECWHVSNNDLILAKYNVKELQQNNPLKFNVSLNCEKCKITTSDSIVFSPISQPKLPLAQAVNKQVRDVSSKPLVNASRFRETFLGNIESKSFIKLFKFFAENNGEKCNNNKTNGKRVNTSESSESPVPAVPVKVFCKVTHTHTHTNKLKYN